MADRGASDGAERQDSFAQAMLARSWTPVITESDLSCDGLTSPHVLAIQAILQHRQQKNAQDGTEVDTGKPTTRAQHSRSFAVRSRRWCSSARGTWQHAPDKAVAPGQQSLPVGHDEGSQTGHGRSQKHERHAGAAADRSDKPRHARSLPGQERGRGPTKLQQRQVAVEDAAPAPLPRHILAFLLQLQAGDLPVITCPPKSPSDVRHWFIPAAAEAFAFFGQGKSQLPGQQANSKVSIAEQLQGPVVSPTDPALRRVAQVLGPAAGTGAPELAHRGGRQQLSAQELSQLLYAASEQHRTASKADSQVRLQAFRGLHLGQSGFVHVNAPQNITCRT